MTAPVNRIGVFGCLDSPVSTEFDIAPGTSLVCLEEWTPPNTQPTAYTLAWLAPGNPVSRPKLLDAYPPPDLDTMIDVIMDSLNLTHVTVNRSVTATLTIPTGDLDDNDEDFDPYRRAYEFMNKTDPDRIILVIDTWIKRPNGSLIAYIEKFTSGPYNTDELTFDGATPLDL